MKIQIPTRLNLRSTLKFCNTIDELEADTSYIYDCKNMSTVEPFGMLLLGSKVRGFVNSNEGCSHQYSNFQGNPYAAHMGFYKSIYQDYGNEPGEAKGSDTYIPITLLDLKEARDESIKNKIDIYEYIENISKDLAGVLFKSNKNLIECLTFAIRELIRNVYEHSESKELWYAGQYWPTKDIVEISILDEGIGIKNSLVKNKKINIESDEEAIRLALKPGISNDGIGKIGKEIYDNSGFGLYMISNICKEMGNFVICSGNRCLEISAESETFHKASFNGTAIRIRIYPSKLKEISNIKSRLSKLGSEKAEKYKSIKYISVESISNV
ncbi:ATP-binding protein [Clostridium algidicarnis]|uniref:ATP-binding protein n=1 Tax=Clostridium algidicarnis TaxID=37659 RepID=UPI001C0B3653|nr:ATP-binding protein [Clostridium algidicarnis]MBU3208501.1 ATP-binding protein [Clostridium algidicarnis]